MLRCVPSTLGGRVREGGRHVTADGDAQSRPNWNVSTRQRNRARALRSNSTDAERAIWGIMRAHRLNGAAFRRQVPIGPYIVDFVCHAAHLVIEIDGGQHYERIHLARDRRRDAFLASKGFQVLRFNNHDVLTNRAGVAEVIAQAVTHAPSPPLPRNKGVYARLRRAMRGRERRGALGQNNPPPTEPLQIPQVAGEASNGLGGSPPPLAGEG
jgi:very-short-patch-repair endonuclease